MKISLFMCLRQVSRPDESASDWVYEKMPSTDHGVCARCDNIDNENKRLDGGKNTKDSSSRVCKDTDRNELECSQDISVKQCELDFKTQIIIDRLGRLVMDIQSPAQQRKRLHIRDRHRHGISRAANSGP